jgi:charged multivesicular body protein 2A
MMDFLFGQRKTPAEMLRQHQRSLTKAQRDLDRERTKMEQQEKKLVADIKAAAKKNQMVSELRISEDVLSIMILFARIV